MGMKVKRGLGLLVVAVLGYLAVLVLGSAAGNASEPWGTVLDLVEVVALLVVAASVLGGLVLLAWGLLRE